MIPGYRVISGGITPRISGTTRIWTTTGYNTTPYPTPPGVPVATIRYVVVWIG